MFVALDCDLLYFAPLTEPRTEPIYLNQISSPTVQQHSVNSHTQAKAPTGIRFPGFGIGTVAQKPATKKIVISQDTQAFV
jgi:hypothetical protein